MKKIISTLTIILLIGSLNVSAQCSAKERAACSKSKKTDCETKHKPGEITAYYFYGNNRCATCIAVENVTQEAINDFYGSKVAFVAINRDEDDKNPLIAKYEVSGQTLLIIKGDENVDLTNEAFLYARNNPDKFKSKLKTTIDSML